MLKKIHIMASLETDLEHAPSILNALNALGVDCLSVATDLIPETVPPIAPAPVAPVPPIAPAPVAPAAPMAPAPPAPAPVATAPAFALDDLARAASALMDAGKQPALIALLGQFGVQALTQLQKDQYGAFATALRQLGAKI